jgi:hypothetical protein
LVSRFIDNFSAIVAPISDLIAKKNQKIVWTIEAEEAFQKLKLALISAPVLVPPDFDKPFIVQCDASDVGIAGILLQHYDEGEKVVSYYSRKLTKSEKNYSITERECLAVLESIKKFRGYLEATHFEVITDHASLLWLLNKKDPTGRLGRWLLQLQQYDMTLIHRKGKEHVVPDALSRAIVEEIESTSRDKWYVDLIRKVELSPETYPKFQIKQGMLYKFVKCNSELIDSWRLVLPSDSRDKIMKQNHDEKAHLGYTKTINRIKQAYYWPKMYQDVRKYVNSCEICKETKAPNQILRPPMGSARVSSVPWSSISIDFKGPMVRSKSGNTYILVVVDNFSKFILIHPMKSV